MQFFAFFFEICYVVYATRLNVIILRSGIGKKVCSRLNIRKCAATLGSAFFGVLLNVTHFLIKEYIYVIRKEKTDNS